MTLYDVTRELRSAPQLPGAPPAELYARMSMAAGDPCNSSVLKVSLHAATHCDACSHFIDGGWDITQMPLDHFLGPCHVIQVPARTMLDADFFHRSLPPGTRRLLMKGSSESYLLPEAGVFLAEAGVITVGTEAPGIGPLGRAQKIHIGLLQARVAIIEGLDLSQIPVGAYGMVALPLKIDGAEASPCRAVLWEE